MTGELTLWVCTGGAAVLLLAVLATAIVCTVDRPDSGEAARLRAALASNEEA